MSQKEHLGQSGLIKIVNIKASLNWGLSDDLNKFFPNIVPINRPKVELSEIPNPNWLAGYVDGEACFFAEIGQSKTHSTGFQVRLKFILTQHFRDKLLMSSLVNYLDCGVFKGRF